MNMEDYLREMEHGIKCVMDGVWGEDRQLQELVRQIRSLRKEAQMEYTRAESIAVNAEDPDDVAMAAGVHWNAYFGPDKDRHYKETRDLPALQAEMALHEFSVQALAGILLRYGKQGIAIVYGDMKAAPSGRAIGSQDLKNVIWQGRNQALHWEEHEFRVPVKKCFDTLVVDGYNEFANYTKRSMAFELVMLLQWV